MESASIINIITENAERILRLKLKPFKESVTWINCSHQQIKYTVNTAILNVQETYFQNVKFSVLPKITNFLVTELDILELSILVNVELEDINYHIPQQIDPLISSSLFFQTLKDDKICLANGKHILQNTQLGYLDTVTLPHLSKEWYCCLSTWP